ncbi:hypothetical protein M3Y95_00098500 [Aphelenchoides besseyi]|nr:hypothetical protein M3Y95_00098500 [Aphelenchoides besseyi]
MSIRKVVFLSFLVLSLCDALQLTINPQRSEVNTNKPDVNLRCPNNSVFRQCSNICPPKHCGNAREKSPCFSLRCGRPMCQCRENYVQLSLDANSDCVRVQDCP